MKKSNSLESVTFPDAHSFTGRTVMLLTWLLLPVSLVYISLKFRFQTLL